MDKYHPGYFGKVGMRQFHLKNNVNWRPVVNLDQIWTLAGEGVREQYKNTEKVPVIDALQKVRPSIHALTLTHELMHFESIGLR